MTKLRLCTLPALVVLVFLNLPASAANRCELSEEAAKYSAIQGLCKFSDGMAAFAIDDQWGFIDRLGNIVVAPVFDDADDFSSGVAVAVRDGSVGLLNKQGKWFAIPGVTHVGTFSEGLAVASDGKKTGYIDSTGKWIIAPQFERAGDFAGPVAVVSGEDGPASLIDRTGRIVKRFAPQMTVDANGTANGLFKASVEPPAPYLKNLDGRTKPYPKGAESAAYHGQHFVVQDESGLSGMVDMDGKWIIEPVYGNISGLGNGQFLATGAGDAPKVDYLNAERKELFSFDCDDVDVDGETSLWAHAQGCGKHWIVHAAAGVVLSYADERDVTFSGEHILIQRVRNKLQKIPFALDLFNGAGKRVFGQERVPASFDFMEFVVAPGASGPLAITGRREGKTALLDRRYQVITPPDWRPGQAAGAASGAPDDAPMVFKGAQGVGAVDAKGNWVVAPKFERLSSFEFGLAKGWLDDEEVLVDVSGKTYPFPKEGNGFERLAPMVLLGKSDRSPGSMRYDVRSGTMTESAGKSELSWEEGAEGLFPGTLDGKHGLMNAQLKWVVPPTFDQAPKPVLHNGKLMGWKTEHTVAQGRNALSLHGWLGPRGNELAAPRYSDIELEARSGMLLVTEDDLQGVMAADAKIVIDPMPARLEALGDGWFKVEEVTLHGLINQRGEWQVKPGLFDFSVENTSAHAALRPYAIRNKGASKQLMDLDGRLSTRDAPLESLQGAEKSDFWWPAEQRGRSESTIFHGFNFKERVHIPGDPDEARFSEGVIAFTPPTDPHHGKIGLADDKGKLIGLFEYDEIQPMHGGRAVVRKAIETEKYLSMRKESHGDLRVAYGYIDRTGKLVVPLQLDMAGQFAEERATVIFDGNLSLIDASGALLLRGSWRCGSEPVILDAKGKIVWPAGVPAGPCKKQDSKTIEQ